MNSLSTLLFSPNNAYLQTLVLPQSQYVPEAFERAFTTLGRFAALQPHTTGEWEGKYSYRPLEVKISCQEYQWSRRRREDVQKLQASNTSAVYTIYNQEVLVNGVLQGRKQKDPRGASSLCRRNLWRSVIEALTCSGLPEIAVTLSRITYGELKDNTRLSYRKKVKSDVQLNVLRGWAKNVKDDDFRIELTN